jgi:sugar fermentation stimulation protein A
MFAADAEAVFVDRPNRFVARVRTRGRPFAVHCANPGRMTELLVPGRSVILERSPGTGRAYPQTLAAVRYAGETVPLVAARANDLAASRILPLLYPRAVEVRREVRVGGSRFDFLVRMPRRDVLLEVKACTLVEEGIAMFPDAPSGRAARHLRELAALPREAGRPVRGAVLFVLFSPRARSFLPNVHTDPAFAEAFRECVGSLEVHAVAVRTGADGAARVTNLRVPVESGLLSRLAEDRGVYLLAVELLRARRISVGSLGEIGFARGWYVYAGSARNGLAARLARHERRTRGKAFFWHIDFLRAEAGRVHPFAIRTELDLECRLAADVAGIAAGSVPGFGSTDCGCPSHLFRFPGNPLADERFVALLNRYRHRIAVGRG